MFVFATLTPFGISSNNTLISVFWSTDLVHWETTVALKADAPNAFPLTVTGDHKFFNTNVRRVPSEVKNSADNATFVMAYEFNEPGVGWQTGFALTRDDDLRNARWTCVARPSSALATPFVRYAHANPTLRYGGDGWWYLLSTRSTNSSSSNDGRVVNVEDIVRTRNLASFDWEAPAAWRSDVVTIGTFLTPSIMDQVPLGNDWHPDTQPVVRGNASALSRAINDNVSDLDLCTIALPDGRPATVMYYAWGDQGLGATAMVLAMAIVEGKTEEEVLSAYFKQATHDRDSEANFTSHERKRL